MTSENVDVFALHGFLGSKDDWQFVCDFVKKEKPSWNWHSVDLFADLHKVDISMEDWAKVFNEWVSKHSKVSRRVLLGYSMGGRLALHALEQNPSLWSGSVFLSTNPGLMTKEEKNQRLEQDKKWATRFAEEEFHQVLSDWNAQPVFRGSHEPKRKMEVLSREHMVQALTTWSLGRQKDFRSLIELWPFRQTWAAGEKDPKFVELLATLPATDKIQKWVVEDASHRLLFEAPQEVAHFVVRVGSPILI